MHALWIGLLLTCAAVPCLQAAVLSPVQSVAVVGVKPAAVLPIADHVHPGQVRAVRQVVYPGSLINPVKAISESESVHVGKSVSVKESRKLHIRAAPVAVVGPVRVRPVKVRRPIRVMVPNRGLVSVAGVPPVVKVVG